jgi:hypothetical protein
VPAVRRAAPITEMSKARFGWTTAKRALRTRHTRNWSTRLVPQETGWIWLRVSRVCRMLAWISTPYMRPRGVGNASRLSAKVAPIRTIRSRKGLSSATGPPDAPSGYTASLPMVRKLPEGPTKLIFQSSS